MKLSMSLWAWYLREYSPQCSIENDSLAIEGMRFLYDENMQKQKEYAYFLEAESVFSDRNYDGAYILVNRQSILIFRNCNYNELLNSVLSAFDYFNRWESKLIGQAFEHASIQQMLDTICGVIQNPCHISNMDMQIYAYVNVGNYTTDPYWECCRQGSAHPEALFSTYRDQRGDLISELSETPMLVTNVYAGGKPVMMMYLMNENQAIATLAILQSDESLTEMNKQMVQYVSNYLIRAKEFIEPSGIFRRLDQILSDYLDGKEIEEHNFQQLSQNLPKGLWRLLALKNIYRADQIARNAILFTLRRKKDFIIPLYYQQHVIVIVSDTFFQKEITQNYGSLFLNQSIGVSMPVSDIQQLTAAYQQAIFALEKSENQAGLYYCHDYAFQYLMNLLRKNEMTWALIHPATYLLSEYDKENESELYDTLRVFFEEQGSYVNTAQILHIHTNTLKYRLRKITEIIGVDWTDSLQHQYLELSFWLMENEENHI